MEKIQKSIEVDRPIRSVYNQWTQFEEFPRFMDGVKQVKQLDDKRLHWVAEIGGKEKEWTAKITDHVPDHRIAWQSDAGEYTSGVVNFQSINPDRTRVTLELAYDPKGFIENEKVKEFGKRMEQDHSKANEELKKIASDKDVQLSNELDKKHKGKVDKLTKLSGADFDKQYMDAMVSDHKEDIKKFQRVADKGKDAELKQFASQTLPTLKEHLQLAESTVQQVKSASKSGKTPNR